MILWLLFVICFLGLASSEKQPAIRNYSTSKLQRLPTSLYLTKRADSVSVTAPSNSIVKLRVQFCGG